MPPQPSVSFLITTYNDAAYLPDSVATALAQDYSGDIEVVVADDGSDPPAQELYRPQDSRVRLLSLPHAGVCAARNRGVEACRGEIVLFLDCDDLALPHRAAEQVAVLEQCPEAALCGADITRRDAQGNEESWGLFETARRRLEARDLGRRRYLFGPEFPHFLIDHFPFVPSVTALRRQAWKCTGIRFDPRLSQWEDWDWVMRMARVARVAYLRRPVTIYRKRPGSATASTHPAKFAAGARVFRQWRRDFADLSPAETRILRRREAHELLNASRAARSGSRSAALRYALRAMAAQPALATLKATAGALWGPAQR